MIGRYQQRSFLWNLMLEASFRWFAKQREHPFTGCRKTIFFDNALKIYPYTGKSLSHWVDQLPH
jgi:hypothetical protein